MKSHLTVFEIIAWTTVLAAASALLVGFGFSWPGVGVMLIWLGGTIAITRFVRLAAGCVWSVVCGCSVCVVNFVLVNHAMISDPPRQLAIPVVVALGLVAGSILGLLVCLLVFVAASAIRAVHGHGRCAD